MPSRVAVALGVLAVGGRTTPSLSDIVASLRAESKFNNEESANKAKIAAAEKAAKKAETKTSVVKQIPDPVVVEADSDADLVQDGDGAAPKIDNPQIPPPGYEGESTEYHEKYHPGPASHPIDHYIDATCADICQHTCIPQGLGYELGNVGSATGQWIGDVTPDFIEDGFSAVGDWMKGVGQSAVGKPMEAAAEVTEEAAESAGVIDEIPDQEYIPGTNIPVAAEALVVKRSKKSKKSLLKKNIHLKKGSIAKKMRGNVAKTDGKAGVFKRMKDSSCLAECEVAINKCYELYPDVSDSQDDTAEEYTIDPKVGQCVDMEKLRFIEQSGNLHYQLKYNISPSFQQLASLAEPLDHIDSKDLAELGRCASGGDAASGNIAAAQGLLDCMIDETKSYADAISTGLLDITMNPEEYKGLTGPLPQMSAQGVTPSRSKGLDESLFYINDVRCFRSCPGVEIKGALDQCEHLGHCSSDYGDMLFRLGILSTEYTMLEAHETAAATHDKQEAAVGNGDTGKNSATLAPGTTGDAHPDLAKKDEDHPDPTAVEIDPKTVATTSFLAKISKAKKDYSRVPPSAMALESPPFCKAQMCAPFPASWISGDWRLEMEKIGKLEACPAAAEAVMDTHPSPAYDGTLEVKETDPTPEAGDSPQKDKSMAAEAKDDLKDAAVEAATAGEKTESAAYMLSHARRAAPQATPSYEAVRYKMIRESEKAAIKRRKQNLARSMQAAAAFHEKKKQK